MKIKWKIVIILSLFGVVGMVWISQFQLKMSAEKDFLETLSSINENRINLTVSKERKDINEFLYTSEDVTDDFTDEEIELLIDNSQTDKTVFTISEASDDVETLFRLLENVYGGYGYYSRDDFTGAKYRILTEIKSNDSVTKQDLERIIAEQLTFITDGHFRIGSYIVNRDHQYHYYFNQSTEIYSSSKGFYYRVDNMKHYIKKINGSDNIENFIKKSINPEGKLTYYFGVFQTINDAINELNVEYSSDSELGEDTFELQITKNYGNHENYINKAFEYYTEECIAVLKCRRLDDRLEENTLRQFVESGQEMKNEDAFILDLRGNAGGSDIWSELWFENFTGELPETGAITAKKYSKLYLSFMERLLEQDISSILNKYKMPELDEVVSGYFVPIEQALASKSYGKWDIQTSQRKWQENESVIFVLVDQNVASAAESFIESLRCMENVVLVGVNSSGCVDFADIQSIYLPNTDLNVRLGVGIFMKSNPEFIDGKGYEPDLWLGSEDVLERVIKLINNYNL